MQFGRGLPIGSVGWPANRLAGRFKRVTKVVLATLRKMAVGQRVTIPPGPSEEGRFGGGDGREERGRSGDFFGWGRGGREASLPIDFPLLLPFFFLRAQYRNLGIPGGKIPSAAMSRMWLDE